MSESSRYRPWQLRNARKNTDTSKTVNFQNLAACGERSYGASKIKADRRITINYEEAARVTSSLKSFSEAKKFEHKNQENERISCPNKHVSSKNQRIQIPNWKNTEVDTGVKKEIQRTEETIANLQREFKINICHLII